MVETAPSLKDLVRRQIWISPEQRFDWRRSELFLRQLLSISHRVGLEITGNHEQVSINLLCHRGDLAVVSAALKGEFDHCVLAEPRNSALSRLSLDAWEGVALQDYYPAPPYSHLLTRPDELHTSPYEPLVSALSTIPAYALGICQVLFQPVAAAHDWHRNVETLLDLEYTIKLMEGPSPVQRYAQQAPSGDLRHMAGELETKAHNDRPFFAAAIRVAVIGAGLDNPQFLRAISTFVNLFHHGGRRLKSVAEGEYTRQLSLTQIRNMFMLGNSYRPGFLVNSWELTGAVHIPPTSITERPLVRFETLETLPVMDNNLRFGTRIGVSDFAGTAVRVCIPSMRRRSHTHIVGRPNMGKSSLMEHMILDDVAQGHGVAVLDPHGDLIERLLCLLPETVVDRSIYFNPGDRDQVPLWNPLCPIPGQDLGRTADDLVGAFKSFVSGWGDRLEHLLRHSFYALLHIPGSTLMDVSNLFRVKSDEGKQVRASILQALDNAVARQFWQHDFQRYGKDDFGPPKNKLSKLLVSDTVSLMLSQPDSTINLRRIMDDGMIFLANLSTVGSETREILGCLLLALFHLTALSRSDTPADQRRQFQIYCDEAHRFMTDAMEDLIAETRKFGVGLTMAHQFMRQFSERKAGALNSVASTIIFNVDTKDAGRLVTGLRGQVKIEDLISLDVGEAIARIGTEVVRVRTLAPHDISPDHSRERILRASRDRFCRPARDVRRTIADHCNRWYGSSTWGYVAAATQDDGEIKELVYDEFD